MGSEVQRIVACIGVRVAVPACAEDRGQRVGGEEAPQDLKAYDASNRGVLAAAGDWVKDNWEYIVGGVAIVGGQR